MGRRAMGRAVLFLCALLACVLTVTATQALGGPLITTSDVTNSESFYGPHLGSGVYLPFSTPSGAIRVFDFSLWSTPYSIDTQSYYSDRATAAWGDRATFVDHAPAGLAGVFVVYPGTGFGRWVATASDTSDQFSSPDIYESKIVYQFYDSSESHSSIRMVDYDTSANSQVAVTGERPRIFGRWVAYEWEHTVSGHSREDIAVKDLASGTTRIITNDTAMDNRPDVSNEWVVWRRGFSQPLAGVSQEVWAFNLGTGERVRVDYSAPPTNLAYQYVFDEPMIIGNKVVYTAKRWRHYTAPGSDDTPLGTSIRLYDLGQRRRSTVVAEDPALAYEKKHMGPGYGSLFPWVTTAIEDPDVFPLVEQNGKIRLSQMMLPYVAYSSYTVASPYGGHILAAGTVTLDGAPSPSRTVWIERSTNRIKWTKLTHAHTSASGTFFVTSPPTPSSGFYRVSADGTGGSSGITKLSGVGAEWSAASGACLTKPSVPSYVRRNVRFSATGDLKPRHTNGSKPVKLVCQKRIGGVWTYVSTFRATARNYSSYSRYYANPTLTSTGEWRYRAEHPADPSNTFTASNWRYFTVH